MESRLFQYSIPYFSFDNAKFHSIKLNFIRWGTRWYEFMPLSVLRFGVLRLLLVSLEWVLTHLE